VVTLAEGGGGTRPCRARRPENGSPSRRRDGVEMDGSFRGSGTKGPHGSHLYPGLWFRILWGAPQLFGSNEKLTGPLQGNTSICPGSRLLKKGLPGARGDRGDVDGKQGHSHGWLCTSCRIRFRWGADGPRVRTSALYGYTATRGIHGRPRFGTWSPLFPPTTPGPGLGPPACASRQARARACFTRWGNPQKHLGRTKTMRGRTSSCDENVRRFSPHPQTGQAG